MEVLLKFDISDYEIKEFEDTGTMLIRKRGMEGKPDYSIEGEGFVIEFKEGEIYIIDLYDPTIAQDFKDRHLLQISG